MGSARILVASRSRLRPAVALHQASPLLPSALAGRLRNPPTKRNSLFKFSSGGALAGLGGLWLGSWAAVCRSLRLCWSLLAMNESSGLAVSIRESKRLASRCATITSQACGDASRVKEKVMETRDRAEKEYYASLKRQEDVYAAGAAADPAPVQETDEAPCMSLSSRLEAVSGPIARRAGRVSRAAWAALCFATFAVCAASEAHKRADTAQAAAALLCELLQHAGNAADDATSGSENPSPASAGVAASSCAAWHDRSNSEEDYAPSDEEEKEQFAWEQMRREEAVAAKAVAEAERRIQEQCGDDYAVGDLTIMRIYTDGPLPQLDHYPDPEDGAAVLRALHVVRLRLEQRLGVYYWRACSFYLRRGHADAQFFDTIQEELKARALANGSGGFSAGARLFAAPPP